MVLSRSTSDRFWSARLSFFASVLECHGLAIVLRHSDEDFTTYAQHNVDLGGGWQRTIRHGLLGATAENVTLDGGIEAALADGSAAGSLSSAPLVWDGRHVGALVALRANGAGAAIDGCLLTKIAQLASLELAETSALYEADRRARELELRLRLRGELYREVGGNDHPQTALDHATKRLAELFEADAVSLMLLNEEGVLVVRSAIGEREQIVRRAQRRLGEGISGWVAQHGEPLLLTGAVTDARFDGVDPSIARALVAPVRADGRIVGVVNVTARKIDANHGGDQLARLASVGEELGIAIARSEALARSREAQRALELERRQGFALAELARILALGHELEADLQAAVEMLEKTLGNDVVALWTLDGNEESLRLRAHHGYGEIIPQSRVFRFEGELGRALGERRPLSLAGVESVTAWSSPRASSYLLAPLFAASLSGVLVVGRNAPYSDGERAFTAALADYLGILIGERSRRSSVASNGNGQTITASRLHDLAEELTTAVFALDTCRRLLQLDPALPDQLSRAVKAARAALGRLDSPVPIQSASWSDPGHASNGELVRGTYR